MRCGAVLLRIMDLKLVGKDKGWSGMTLVEQEAAGVLGYDAESWDAGETPPACEQPWWMLRKISAQLAAAQALGYTESEWDAEVYAVLPSPEIERRAKMKMTSPVEKPTTAVPVEEPTTCLTNLVISGTTVVAHHTEVMNEKNRPFFLLHLGSHVSGVRRYRRQLAPR